MYVTLKIPLFHLDITHTPCREDDILEERLSVCLGKAWLWFCLPAA